jgi:hypothetical protein
MANKIMASPECFVVLGEKSNGHEMPPSKWLSFAKISDLLEKIVVNGHD